MAKISRVTRSREAARAAYDRLSRVYDLIAGGSEQKYTLLGLRLLNVTPGEAVLEIGCGTGGSLVELARQAGNSGRIFGLDISEGMLSVARGRLQKVHLSEQVELRCGDAAALPYPADSFDAVFMSFTLELFDTPEIPHVLQECRRVLRPRGRIGIVAMSNQGKPNLMTRLYDWAHVKMPALVDCRPIPARAFLEVAGFKTHDFRLMWMWGLPLEIIVAEVGHG